MIISLAAQQGITLETPTDADLAGGYEAWSAKMKMKYATKKESKPPKG